MKYVRGFQTKNSIVVFCVFLCCAFFNQGCCVFIQYNLLEGCCKCILIQLWTPLIEYSLPGLWWHIKLSIGISHLSISRIVVLGIYYISHCFCFSGFSMIFWWLIVAFIFMSLDSSSQKLTPTFLFPYWLIIKLHHYYYGSITLYYITKLHYSRLLDIIISLMFV